MNDLPLLRSSSQLRSRIKSWRAFGETVALVPVFGPVHEGHAELIRAARREGDRVLVAVVPAADAPEGTDDSRALALADEAGADALYAPSVFRPQGFASRVHVAGVSEVLEGEEAPQAFDGFAADLARLLSQTRPDVTLFGAPEFQRAVIGRRLAEDLDLCPRVLAMDLPRDEHGLQPCMATLDEAGRAAAARLWRTLSRAAGAIAAGADADATLDQAADALADAGAEVEYLDLRDADTLDEIDAPEVGRQARIFAAVVQGGRRLTDNMAVGD
jgi:pantoate--beta-alanine ligase